LEEIAHPFFGCKVGDPTTLAPRLLVAAVHGRVRDVGGVPAGGNAACGVPACGVPTSSEEKLLILERNWPLCASTGLSSDGDRGGTEGRASERELPFPSEAAKAGPGSVTRARPASKDALSDLGLTVPGLDVRDSLDPNSGEKRGGIRGVVVRVMGPRTAQPNSGRLGESTTPLAWLDGEGGDFWRCSLCRERSGTLLRWPGLAEGSKG